ncbi:MAG: hypothetical protein AB7T27_03760 [Kiritimatiellia bacterium]
MADARFVSATAWNRFSASAVSAEIIGWEASEKLESSKNEINAIFGKKRPFLSIFGRFLAIFEHFWPFLSHF